MQCITMHVGRTNDPLLEQSAAALTDMGSSHSETSLSVQKVYLAILPDVYTSIVSIVHNFPSPVPVV